MNEFHMRRCVINKRTRLQRRMASCRKGYSMKLTSRERLTRIFENREIDRPSLKLWGASLNLDWMLHPAYEPVARLAAETTDILDDINYPFNIYAGQNIGQ